MQMQFLVHLEGYMEKCVWQRVFWRGCGAETPAAVVEKADKNEMLVEAPKLVDVLRETFKFGGDDKTLAGKMLVETQKLANIG